MQASRAFDLEVILSYFSGVASQLCCLYCAEFYPPESKAKNNLIVWRETDFR